jgi:hypothetical protein
VVEEAEEACSERNNMCRSGEGAGEAEGALGWRQTVGNMRGRWGNKGNSQKKGKGKGKDHQDKTLIMRI